jgi:trans-aconitate methyltransferase
MENMNWQDQTIKSYDDSAAALAGYFKSYGARVEDIELGIKLAASEDKMAKVVEIGCGDGRDAAEIINRVEWYQGFDPSKELLKIARTQLPDASFIKADALSYDYPLGVDLIFAFASLLHVDKQDLSRVIEKADQSLKPKGVLYLSLKESDYYNPKIIESLSRDLFEPVHVAHQFMNETKWFTMALKKI